MKMKKLLLPLILTLILIFSVNCFATAWDVSTAIYADKLKDVSTQDTYPYGIDFSSDGTKMYIMGYMTDTVYQYTLLSAWDVDTATYANKSKDIGTEEGYPVGVAFSSDGSKMYIIGTINDTVYQYTLSTPWDVDTAAYAEKLKDVGTEEGYPLGVTFSSDGSKMYVIGTINNTVYQYILSTTWDVSTATYAEKLKVVSDEDTSPNQVTFSSDGSKMYVMGYANNAVYQYTLLTVWDVDTATYADKSKVVSDEDINPRGMTFSSDGTKMYMVGVDTDTVYQYTLLALWSHKWNTKEISKWDTKEFTKWNDLE